MKLAVYNGQSKVNDIELKTLLGEKSDEVLYQAVVARLSHDREGNASTLTKSEVRGGGKKPWKQKGLGRARAGSTRSPLWRGGGVTFGPKPRDHSKDINKKQKAKALLSIFTKMAEADALKVVSDISVSTAKTKDFLKTFASFLPEGKRVTFVVENYDQSLVLASRNLPKISVLNLNDLDMLPLFYSDQIVISEKAALALDARLTEVFN